MKYLIAICLFITCALPAFAKPYITIGPLKLVRISPGTEKDPNLREYVLEGESPDRWTRLASIRVFPDQKDPKKYLGAVAGMVAKSDSNAKYQFFQDKKTKQIVLDFLVFSPARAQQNFAEWNMMRAEYVKKKGLVVHQYAMRIYDFDDGSAINSERARMLDPFKQASFEEIEDPN